MKKPPEPTNDELAESARRDVALYAHLVHRDDRGQPIKAARHHQLWVRYAHKIAKGEIRRLLIIAPPGGAKSTWWSLTFVPWYLGHNPDHSVLGITSSDSQASKFGGVVSGILDRSPEHAAIFPDGRCRGDKLRGWSADKGYYLGGMPISSKDPSYQMVGRTSKVIGNRCRGIVLDDLLDERESRSDTTLQDAKDDIDNTFETRLHPTEGWMVAVMTSWNERDVPHFLAKKPNYEVIHIPALGDPEIKPISKRAYFYPLEKGESFWPARFPPSFLKEIRSDPDRGGAKFNAVYQGDPTAMGGDVFKSASWFRPFPPDFDVRSGPDERTPRERLNIFAWMDPAFSYLETSDFSAIVIVGMDSRKNCYILGARRGHWSVKSEYVANIVDMVSIHQPHVFGMELSAFRQRFCQDIWSEVRDQIVVGLVKPQAAQGDKQSRARVPAGYGEQGKLHIDSAAPWAMDLQLECLGFPKGLHDDYVDALSGAVSLAAEQNSKTIIAPVHAEARPKFTMKPEAPPKRPDLLVRS